MIRRISSLALGIAFVFTAASAFAEEAAEGGGGEEKPAEEAKPAEGGGDAKAGGSAAVSTDALPASKGAFGKSGQIAISGDLQLGFESRSSKPPEGDSVKTTTITVAPALDYFVVDSISVGAAIGYRSVKTGDADPVNHIMLAPRVGYNLGLTDNISFWPKLGFAYQMISTTQTVPTATGGTEEKSISGNKMTVMVNAPILYHPAEHFFIGLGPQFEMDLSSKIEGEDSSKDTAFGLGSVVGGWF